MKSRLEVLFVPVNERYTMLSFDYAPKKLDIVPEMPRLCQIILNGCDSPITFQVQIVGNFGGDSLKPDLVIYLSTEAKEPSISDNMKAAGRLRKFKFFAPN